MCCFFIVWVSSAVFTWILDSGSPVMVASASFVLMSGYCVSEKAFSRSESCPRLKMVRFLRLCVLGACTPLSLSCWPDKIQHGSELIHTH